jgi:PAS domain S-box-containing protein
MARPINDLTGVERTFGDDEIIVSKTDLTGHITYANRLFVSISGYTEAELIGKPHCLLRHPDMPRAIFRLLWTTISSGKEIFAYVVNRCKNGDHYWVFAHVTPSFDAGGNIVGYHSNRRSPDREHLGQIMPLYSQLIRIERQHSNPKAQMAASTPVLNEVLDARGVAYEEFIFSL